LPLPMIHMLVADKAAAKAEMNISGRLLLGSIAPDAVRMRDGASREESRQAHLQQEDVKAGWNSARAIIKQRRDDPFAVGYALHIMTDILWRMGPFKEFLQLRPEDVTEQAWRRVYNRDMAYTGSWLYAQSRSRELWKIIMAAPPMEFDGLVTAAEVGAWRQITLNELGRGYDEAPEEKRMELSRVLEFIDECADRLAEQLIALRRQ